jgi:hypothetical protein
VEIVSELFAASYLTLDDSAQDVVDGFVKNILWRCERGRPLGQPIGDDKYVVVTPALSDGSKLRIMYADEAENRRIILHALSRTSAAAGPHPLSR